ncbi:DUF4123 domain-containing protein [Sphaerotilaceae bacterium SBD11-9]
MPTAPLYDDTFAKGALAFSPVVMEFDPDMQTLEPFDSICHHLPVLALLRTQRRLGPLTHHLRERLLVEADGEPFMLRLADTQMLAAANAAFSPEQRAAFFEGVDAWVAADHKGRLQNMADRATFAQAPVPASLPPQLDGHQLRCLLEASAAPALASQLREFDPGFGQALNHAQQIAFAHECIVQARLDAVDMDAELPSFTLQRWQARQREATA